MNYTQISTTPDIYEIRTPVWSEKFLINCYAVHDEGEWLLIDTGMPKKSSRELVSGALEAIGFDWSRAKIALTHLHIDHGGLVNQLARKQTEVFIGSKELKNAQTVRSLSYATTLWKKFRAEGFSRPDICGSIALHWTFSKVKEPRMKVVTVEPGDTFSVGSLRFQVIDTTGHSVGHVSYFEQTHGILFGGDHMLHYMLPAIDWFPDSSDSVEPYLANTQSLLTLPINTFLVSHGESKPTFKERLQEIIDRHEQRLDEFVEVVEKEPGISGLNIIRQISWLDTPKQFEKIDTFTRCCILCEGLASLNHLVLTERISRKEEGKKVNRYYSVEDHPDLRCLSRSN